MRVFCREGSSIGRWSTRQDSPGDTTSGWYTGPNSLRSAAVVEITRRPQVTRLALTGLADSEIAGLVTDLMPAGSSADRLAAVIVAAEGNPLYARELARAGPEEPPASIAAAVLARLAELPTTARAVLEQICVADGGMSHELVAAASGLPEEGLLGSLHQPPRRSLSR